MVTVWYFQVHTMVMQGMTIKSGEGDKQEPEYLECYIHEKDEKDRVN